MPHRAFNAVLILAGLLAVAGLIVVGADLARASRSGPRWKRKLIAAGLFALGAIGIGGCPTAEQNPQAATPGLAAPADGGPAASPVAARQWRQFVEGWDEAREIAEGRWGEQPVTPEDRPALLARLAAAEKCLDALRQAGHFCEPEAALFREQFERHVAQARRLTAPPPAGAGRFDGPWSAEVSLRRLEKRLSLLAGLLKQPKLWAPVRGELVQTARWDLTFLQSSRGRSRLPDARRAHAADVCRQAARLVRELRSLPPARLKFMPPMTGLPISGIFDDPIEETDSDFVWDFLEELGRLKGAAYQATLVPGSPPTVADLAYLLKCHRQLAELAREGRIGKAEAKALSTELYDAAEGIRLRPIVRDGRAALDEYWAAKAKAAYELLNRRVGPMRDLIKVKRAHRDIYEPNLDALHRAAAYLLDLAGAAALPAADRRPAERVAREARDVIDKWLKLMTDKGLPLPSFAHRDPKQGHGIFDDEEEDGESGPIDRYKPSTLCREVRRLRDRYISEHRPGWEEGESIFDGDDWVLPDDVDDWANLEATLSSFDSRRKALLAGRKLSPPEATLLRLEIELLERELPRRKKKHSIEVWDAAHLSADLLSPSAPHPSPRVLVARARRDMPLLEKLAALPVVRRETIELGLEALDADVLRLDEYVREARAKKGGMWQPGGIFENDDEPGLEWDLLAFLDPNTAATTVEKQRHEAEKEVAAAEKLAESCKQLLSRIRRAAGPRKGAKLADTPEWRRMARTWREAEQVCQVAYPFNDVGRRRLVLRVGLAAADVAALAEADLLTAPEADLLATNLRSFHEFLLDRRTTARRHALCYGSGPAEFPRRLTLKRLTERASLLAKLSASGKLRPAVCAKSVSVIANELARPAAPDYQDKSATLEDPAQASKTYAQLRAEAKGHVTAIRAKLRPQLGPLGDQPQWKRLLASMGELLAVDTARGTVSDQLRALRVMGRIRADLKYLRGLGLLTPVEADLLVAEADIRMSRIVSVEPRDLRAFDYDSYDRGSAPRDRSDAHYSFWPLFGEEGSFSWALLRERLAYRLVARTRLLKLLLARGAAAAPLAESVHKTLDAELEDVDAKLDGGMKPADLLAPYETDPTKLNEALREARKLAELLRPPPGGPAPKPRSSLDKTPQGD